MSNFVNGTLENQLSVHDRGLLYGQSVFETICVDQQLPLLLDAHMRRLQRGCKALHIECEEATVREEIKQACQTLSDVEKAVLRVTVSMGVGGRGYLNPEQTNSVRIISVHPFPRYEQDFRKEGITLGLSEVVLSSQPLLAGIKHGNRLEQVLARNQWQPEWQEALLLDAQQRVIEATHSNLFIRQGEVLLTPELNTAGVAGVMRETILESAQKLKIEANICSLSVHDVNSADEVFISNSLIGIWPVNYFQERHYSDFYMSQTLLNSLRDYGAI